MIIQVSEYLFDGLEGKERNLGNVLDLVRGGGEVGEVFVERVVWVLKEIEGLEEVGQFGEKGVELKGGG